MARFCFCKFKKMSLYGSKSNVLTTSHVYAYGRYMKRRLAVLCGRFYGSVRKYIN